jgi:hypothetical protein
MQFELFHFSMIERGQGELFDQSPAPVREKWLRDVFSQKITFMHRGEQFHYVPETGMGVDPHPLIVGRIGRQVSMRENEPPEAGLHETHRIAWLASFLIIDPRSHAEGQKAAMQYREDIGKPLPLPPNSARP